LFDLFIFNNFDLFFKLGTPCTLSILFNVQDAKEIVKANIAKFFKMDIENLYNKKLGEARNPEVFSKYLEDNLNNKLLIFLIYWTNIFNKIDKNDPEYQKLFDYIFHRIETDLREIGYGDMSVNKKMKVIVTKFYSILIDFKDFESQSLELKTNNIKKYFPNIKEIDQFSSHLDVYLAVDNH